MTIATADKGELDRLHTNFRRHRDLAGYSTAAATFLIIGALVVIGGASLCLTLPGINVITDVVLPGILPGTGALLLSIPPIIFAVRHMREKARIRADQVHKTLVVISHAKLEDMAERRERVTFLRTNLFHEHGFGFEYYHAFINELKKRLPKEESDRNPPAEKVAEALDKVLIMIQKNK